jgi:sec-independent protein translocase protein TatC
MTFLEHLGELRIRLIRCVIALTLAMIICFIFSDKLIALLIDCVPKDKVQVVTLHPIEAFLTILKLSLVGGLFVAFPVLFYEIWMFIAPGLYKKERRFVLPLAIASWIFFVAGGVFCYLVVFRFALTFFASMAGSAAGNMWGLSNYLNFMIRFLLAFAIVFEEPVIILLLAKVGLVSKAILSKFRPYAIIVMFVLAAIITPPDPFSQLMCAAPLLLLYEFSIIMIGFVEKKKLEEEASG